MSLGVRPGARVAGNDRPSPAIGPTCRSTGMWAAYTLAGEGDQAREAGFMSEQFAGLVKIQAWAAREQPCRITIAQIAEEIRLDVAVGKVLLLEGALLCARRKKFMVNFCMIEPGHRTTIQSERAGSQDEISPL
jgi:hypothetical protein